MQTIHEISHDRFVELTGSKGARQKTKEVYPDEIPLDQEFTEGGKTTATVNAFERNRRARDICISVRGIRCSVCSLSFEEVYGDIGEGFIHVHHLDPIAARDGRYRLRPMTDLAPVCPNCHAMLHTSNPPLTIQELKRTVRSRRRK